MSEFIRLHVDAERPGLGTIVISRPPTNALTRQAYRELGAAAEEAAQRDDVSAVILYGGHEIFCAGDDVPELRTLNDAEATAASRLRRDTAATVAGIPKPTVAAVTGYALGGGLGLALAADWRVVGDNVKFGATEILAGLAPDAGTLARLGRTAGAARAKELVFSGRFFDAEEAVDLGLVEEMVAPDGVYEAALAWVERFGDAPAQALSAAKAGIDDAFA